MIACGRVQPDAGVVTPNNDIQNVNSTGTQSVLAVAEFDLSTANQVPPDDVLQEVTFYGGGGAGFCDGMRELTTPEIWRDPSDEELLVTSIMITCGWEKDEILQATIQYPDGTLFRTEIKADHGMGFLEFRPAIDDPVGIYFFGLQGKNGFLSANAEYRKPNGPRLSQTQYDNIFLSGFFPEEKVRLFYYSSAYELDGSPGGMLAGWQEYQVNVAGQMEIKLSLQPGDDLAVIGEKSGEVHLLHTGFFGGASDHFRQGVSVEPDMISVDYSNHLNCPPDLLVQSSLQHGADAFVVENEVTLFGNPRQSARIIDVLSVGTAVSVTQGPYCSGEMVWWRVYVEHTYGYILEFDGQKYYLKP